MYASTRIQDIFSYNVEQSRGDTHNMISVFMQRQGMDLQSAVDAVGNLCKASIDRFETDRKTLPSWGPEIDRDVQAYVQGLQDWIVGSLHWSFDTTRYFAHDGARVKKERVVRLLPARKVSSIAIYCFSISHCSLLVNRHHTTKSTDQISSRSFSHHLTL